MLRIKEVKSEPRSKRLTFKVKEQRIRFQVLRVIS